MGADLQPGLERIIRDRDFAALRGMLENLPPVDLASLLVRPGTEDQIIVFRVPPRKLVATVFEYMDAPAKASC